MGYKWTCISWGDSYCQLPPQVVWCVILPGGGEGPAKHACITRSTDNPECRAPCDIFTGVSFPALIFLGPFLLLGFSFSILTWKGLSYMKGMSPLSTVSFTNTFHGLSFASWLPLFVVLVILLSFCLRNIFIFVVKLISILLYGSSVLCHRNAYVLGI